MNTRMHVVVGILYNANRDKVLITKRTGKQFLSGYWEFPGGKVKSNEDSFSALSREFYEELGICLKSAKRLIKIHHDYPEKKLLLDVWEIYEWEGEPIGLENQEINWVDKNNLFKYKFPEANKRIIQTLYLPDIYGISESSYKNYSNLFSAVRNYFNSGLKIFQLRHSFERNSISRENIEELHEEARRNTAKLILNGVASDVEYYTVNGIHLKSKELLKYDSRPISGDYILGASCHNEVELERAEKLSVNYAFISPVLVTKSHPDRTPLGWSNFKRLAEQVNFPVYALGGMSFADLIKAKENGAYGVAMISSIKDLLLLEET